MCGSRLLLVSLGLCAGIAASSSVLAQCSDMDGDGFGRPGDPSCPQGEQQDCNDRDASMFPGNAEMCDGFDNDCDGVIDNDPGCLGTCPDPVRAIEPVLLTPGDCESSKRGAVVVWNGREFGVLWRSCCPLLNHFTRLDLRGRLIGGVIDLPWEGGWYPDMVWNGSEYGVAWALNPGTAVETDIHFARLDRQGRALGNPVQLSFGDGRSRIPEIAWSGEQYGVLAGMFKQYELMYVVGDERDLVQLGDLLRGG